MRGPLIDVEPESASAGTSEGTNGVTGEEQATIEDGSGSGEAVRAPTEGE